MRFGSFAGGLASGIERGHRLGLDADEAEQRKLVRESGRERHGLEMAGLRRREDEAKRESEYRAEREKFIRGATMDEVMTEDAGGNLVPGGYRPRQLKDEDVYRLHEGVGALDFRHGKLDPTQAMAMQRSIKFARDEGAFDSYNEFLRSGDPAAAEAVFNKVGRASLVEGSMGIVEKTDELTGQKYRVLRAKTAEGRDIEFDPVAVGRARGGAAAYAKSLETGAELDIKRREVKAREDTAAGNVSRNEARDAAEQRRADQRDRQLDIMAARLDTSGRERPLTTAQKMKNMSIDAARKFVAGLTPEDIKRRTAKFSATGRENTDFDPQLAKRMSLANSRKYGDDPDFDESSASQPQALPKEPAVENRFHADPAMKGRKLGKKTDRGMEVLDASGKLIGFYN